MEIPNNKTSAFTAIILAGGLGTRLQSVVSDLPKPMAPVGGRPFLEYLMAALSRWPISKVILSIGHLGHKIQGYFGDRYKDVEVVYAVEEQPLGTGGAIAHALRLADPGPVLILNGDTFFEIDLPEMIRTYHLRSADLVLALKPMTHFERYGTVDIDKDSRIIGFHEKAPRTQGLINGGVYLLHSRLLDDFLLPDRFSFENDFLENYYAQLKMFAYISDGYFIDIGVPDDYSKAQQDFFGKWL